MRGKWSHQGNGLARSTSARGKPVRRRRDPDGTRAAILEAARTLLAKDGPEGLSVSQVAQLAGVNRGTAYQHFQTREQLLAATMDWVSEELCRAVFGESASSADGQRFADVDPQGVAEHLVQFAMENPELGRIWLFQILSSSRPSSDPFFKLYKMRFDGFAKSDSAQPGVDGEVHTVLMLVGAFLWPVWAGAHSRTAKERQQMAKRYSYESLRLSMYGTMRPEKYPELDAKMSKIRDGRKRAK
jgi:AcrR family transcriptional regulator